GGRPPPSPRPHPPPAPPPPNPPPDPPRRPGGAMSWGLWGGIWGGIGGAIGGGESGGISPPNRNQPYLPTNQTNQPRVTRARARARIPIGPQATAMTTNACSINAS